MSEKEYKLMFRSDLILEIKRLRKEYGQLRDRSYEKVEELEQQLKEANEVIRFYGDVSNYGWDDVPTITSRDCGDVKHGKIGGKQAREYLSKYKGKRSRNG